MHTVAKTEGSQRQTDLTTLSDTDLVRTVAERAAGERHATADLIRALIEFDRRRLYLAEGYSSLYAYCTQALHYSEYGAFNRIEVARAAARWPQLLARIEDGSLHLSGARLLAPHLTEENIDAALASATHKSKREIEEVAAALAHRAVLVAVAAEQYRLHLTISRQARDTLREVQALLSHQVPDINAAVVVERALSVLLDKLHRERLAATEQPRPAKPSDPSSRRIPAAVRREVWKRDGGRCAFVGRQGRCSEQHRIEFHHVVPFAAGGAPSASNIQLRCRAHNGYEAETFFGAETVAAARERKSGTGEGPVCGGGTTEGGDVGGPAGRPGASSTQPLPSRSAAAAKALRAGSVSGLRTSTKGPRLTVGPSGRRRKQSARRRRRGQ
jgi:hypothetical protein